MDTKKNAFGKNQPFFETQKGRLQDCLHVQTTDPSFFGTAQHSMFFWGSGILITVFYDPHIIG